MKKRILYLAFRFPYPQTDGYKLRVFNYCKILKELGHDIDLFFIYESKKEYEEYMNQAKDIFTKIYPVELTKLQKVKNLIKSFMKFQSLQENIYVTKNGKKLMGELKNTNYDLYFSSYIRMFKYLSDIPKKKRVIDFTDSISYHYDEARKLSKGMWNIIHKYEFNKVKKYEHFVLDNCDRRMITSPLDRDYILKNYTGENKKIEIFSQGINEELIKRGQSYKRVSEKIKIKKLVFLGKMNYYPNEDAVINFCNNVLSKLEDVELVIVGTSPTLKILELQKKYKNVIVTGFVEDPYKYVLEADVMIAPMRLGGGIQNKILEGMALGKTVICYEDRVKSIIGVKNNKNMITVKSDKAMIAILNNELNIEKIGAAARDVVLKNYTWKEIKIQLKNILS